MTDLYCITCMIKGQQGTIQLQFHSAEAAKTAFHNLTDDERLDVPVLVEDSYGMSAHFGRGTIATVTLTHINRWLDGQRETQLLQARANAKTQQAAASDPMLRMMAAPSGGVVMPMGRG